MLKVLVEAAIRHLSPSFPCHQPGASFSKRRLPALVSVLTLSAFPVYSQTKPATETTIAANAAVLKALPFDDTRDFDDARQGFIAPLPDDGLIKAANGKVVLNLPSLDFIKPGEKAPDTVNPSLWRNEQLLSITGLFKVVDRIYQVRGADISVITFIEGDTGIIIVDPLISAETARAGLDLYYQYRSKKPVVAVIYTHSHVDHFGGVRGVISEDDVKSGKVRIIAPDHFTEEAVSENILAGNAMARRAGYMYGRLIPNNAQGSVGSGIGLSTSSGTVTLIRPTDIIKETGDQLKVDGLTFQFQLAPGTEAPAELHFFIPELKALCTAENAIHTLHNLYTLRGAKTRDAHAWVEGLNKTIELWGDKAEVLFAPHQWPIWGNARIVDHLERYRDTIKYIHDQTLHLANQGYTMIEIADLIKLPPSLEQYWSSHGYYGTVSHDAKAVYNYYLGYFSANPADLDPLPPVDASKKYVEFMGGADAVLEKAQKSFDQGDYRWVAEVVNHVVLADPNNEKARNLQADALEQLGYQSEASTWRNFYLTGAQELRTGVNKSAISGGAFADVVRAMPIEDLFDFLAIKLDGPRAEDKIIHIALSFPDKKQVYYLTVKHGVLNYSTQEGKTAPDCTLTINRSDLDDVILGRSTFVKKVADGVATVDGSKSALGEFLGLLDKFDPSFSIVTANPPPAP